MTDLAAAMALALVLEGLVYAAFPEQMKGLLKAVMATPANSLRFSGLGLAGVGLLVLWLIRG